MAPAYMMVKTVKVL